MKKIKHTVLVLFSIITLSCDGDTINNVKEACDETPSSQYLVSVRNVDYAQIGTRHLNNPVNHNIDICNQHFAANTTAGHQFNLATNEVSDVLGSKLNFTRTWTGNPHKNSFDLFPSNPTSSIFDYLDVSTPMPNRCSLPNDLTFAMRTCRFDTSGGGTNYFTIMVKSTSYNHFLDPTYTNHPTKHGILHELAHAYGMNHTPNWNSADKHYISTMQGNLTNLSALDVSYLRNNYSENTINHRNYVASTLTRFNYTKGIFWKQNPKAYYIDSNGNLKDCKTKASPEFFTAWFNTGNIDGENELCGLNRLFLREKTVAENTIEIKTWRIETMPYLSQDQWKGQVDVNISDTSGINYNSEWELVFQVNAWNILDETTADDNEVVMDIILNETVCSKK